MLLPTEAPVMTLPNVILFPQAMLPVFIFEPRYRRMLENSLATHRTVVIAMAKPGSKRETPSKVGGLGLIRAAVKNKDGTSHLVLQGLARVVLGKVVRYQPYRVHQIEPIPNESLNSSQISSLTSKVLDLVIARMENGLDFSLPIMKHLQSEGELIQSTLSFKEVIKHLRSVKDPSQLVDLVSCTLLPIPLQRQIILETYDLETRLDILVQFLISSMKTRSKW